MKTIKDIIEYIYNADYGYSCCFCKRDCNKYNWCYVDSANCALNYLYNGEY